MLSDDACLTLSDDSASHALGYYRGVLRNSSLEPKAPALCPGLSLFSVNRRAPNRQQAPALVKWSWRPFWGCRRYDKSRPVASRGGSGRIAWARPGLSFMSAPWGLSWNAMRKRRVGSVWAISSWRAIMKKLSMLGIIVGAALLSAAPFSLQWSQKDVALSLDSADARVGRPLTATSVAGVHRRAHRRAYRRGYYY